ncbi:high-potential iron-sulfur protein [Thaumasiovibrio sp. DFM-14]|uniref:high-potential iron-sulfur protein n=1 Tax=Thaumasiovibrio sp. DFM-14 TaxID=3384792 RepID=UPI00399F8342
MKTSRRQFLKLTVGGVIAVSAGDSLIGRAHADTPKLEESDAQASALKYVHQSDRGGKNCNNCALLQGNSGDEWRPCAIFPGKLVSANGWCTAWVAKP